MNDEFLPELITLAGEDGENVEFELLDTIEVDGKLYYILSPWFSNPAEALSSRGSYSIFEVEDCNGQTNFITLDDELQINKISNIFEERYNKLLFED